MIKAGSFIHPGSSSFSVTGIGFKPQWGIFITSNLTTENAWTSPNQLVGCIGFAATTNNAAGQLGINSACVHEIWDKLQADNDKTGGVWVGGTGSDNIIAYVQDSSDGSVDGWSAQVTSFDEDGFSIFSILTSNAAGKRIYYLLADSDFEEVGSAPAFSPGSAAINLGWEPKAFFGVGGGGVNGQTNTQGSVGFSLPTVVAGDWGEYTDFDLSTNGVWRGLFDPNVNVQFDVGSFTNAHDIPILEAQTGAGIWWSTVSRAVRTSTTFRTTLTAGAFGNGYVRMKNFVLGSVDSIVGSFVPTTSVGVPTQVTLPFSPDAVVFFSPQEHRAGIAAQTVQVATGWGWCTDEDQALVIYGGFWNPPNTYQSNGLTSSSHCWVANCLDNDNWGSVGTDVTMGSAVANAEGFEYTTTAHSADPGEVWPVLYWAMAAPSEAPGFFRRV